MNDVQIMIQFGPGGIAAFIILGIVSLIAGAITLQKLIERR